MGGFPKLRVTSFLKGHSMIKLKHTERYILLVIVILILSLIFSIISLMCGNDAGRYQSFVMENSDVYIFDTKTSRLFLRGFVEGKVMCVDLGTVDRPLLRLKSNVIQIGSFIPDAEARMNKERLSTVSESSGFEAWKGENRRLGFAPTLDEGR